MIRMVQGHSMLPVLPPGTLVFGYRWFWHLRPEKVVIAERHNREIIKRIERIEEDGLFLTGDHPEASTDSRQYGTIPKEHVKAVIIWPRVRRVLAEDLTAHRKDTVI